MNSILVTGGLGFIGSHVCVQLLEKGYQIIILDNLSNSEENTAKKIKIISNIGEESKRLRFIEGDIRDYVLLKKIFKIYKIDLVIHFAALKSVSESEKYPDLYNDVNVKGTKTLLKAMAKYRCTNFMYSSSATVYGETPAPVTEDSQVGKTLSCNYAKNKYDMEQYLMKHKKDYYKNWNIIILRYFNPIGAHPSGIIGEDPQGVPNNVFPYLLRVAKWTNTPEIDRDPDSPYKVFTLFGDNYDTRDGTCIRDYVHVEDLARAHVVAIKVIKSKYKLYVYNVGTGKGTTVAELVTALNKTLKEKNKKCIEYKIGNRRPGDIDVSYACVDKIKKEIGFYTYYGIEQMCMDGLNFNEV